MGEPLAPWESFYVIVGSSAGALTGLQFVVLALIADAEAAVAVSSNMLEIRAFGTPTVVHFCAVLFIFGCFERAMARPVQCWTGVGRLWGGGNLIRDHSH